MSLSDGNDSLAKVFTIVPVHTSNKYVMSKLQSFAFSEKQPSVLLTITEYTQQLSTRVSPLATVCQVIQNIYSYSISCITYVIA